MSHQSNLPLKIELSIDSSSPPVFFTNQLVIRERQVLDLLNKETLTATNQPASQVLNIDLNQKSTVRLFLLDGEPLPNLETEDNVPDLVFFSMPILSEFDFAVLAGLFETQLGLFDAAHFYPSSYFGLRLYSGFNVNPLIEGATSALLKGFLGVKSTKFRFAFNPKDRPVRLDIGHSQRDLGSRYDFSRLLSIGEDLNGADRLTGNILPGITRQIPKNGDINLFMIDPIPGVSIGQKREFYRHFIAFPLTQIGPHDGADLFNNMVAELAQRFGWPSDETHVDSMLPVNYMQNGVMQTANALMGSTLTRSI